MKVLRLVMLTTEFGVVTMYWAHTPICFKHMSLLVPVLRSTHNHIPFKYRCLDYCRAQMRHVYLIANTTRTMILSMFHNTKLSNNLFGLVFTLCAQQHYDHIIKACLNFKRMFKATSSIWIYVVTNHAPPPPSDNVDHEHFSPATNELHYYTSQ